MDEGIVDRRRYADDLTARALRAFKQAQALRRDASASHRRVAGREQAAREGLARLRADLHLPGALRRFLLPYLEYADPEDLMTTGLRAALEITGADMGNVQLVDRSGALRIAAYHGFERPFLDFFAVVRDEASVCGLAMAAGRPVAVRDVAHDLSPVVTPTVRTLMEAGVRTVQSVPLLDENGRPLGMLSVHYRSVRDLTPAQRDLLRPVSHRLSRLLRRTLPVL